MRSTPAILAIVFAFIVASCAAETSTVLADADNAVAPACLPIQWGGTDIAEPGVFSVPADVNGERGYMQVDTGAFFSGLYGTRDDWPDLDIKPYVDGPTGYVGGRPADWWLGAELRVAGEVVAADPVLHYHTNPKASNLGTIGGQSLLGRIVRIDPVSDSFCFMDANDAALTDVAFVPMRMENGYMVVGLNADGQDVGEVMFDTGSVLTTVSPDALARLADLSGDPIEVEVSSWGEMIGLRGYPARADLTLGSIPLAATALFEDEAPALEGTLGTLGMSAFPDRAIILDLREGGLRFGVSG